MSKDSLNQLLSDFPAHSERGRSGKEAAQPTVARAARSVNNVDLSHLAEHFPKDDIARMRGKYNNPPDLYYYNRVEDMVTPEKFHSSVVTRANPDSRRLVSNAPEVPAQKTKPMMRLWELCSGSSALSAEARKKCFSLPAD